MEEYQVEFYRKLDGSCPIEEFLNSLEEKIWAKVARNIDTLEEFNINLRESLVKPVEDGIFELRTQVGNNITRIFYFFFSGKKIILVFLYTYEKNSEERRSLHKLKVTGAFR